MVVELVVLLQGFAKHYGGGRVVGGGRDCTNGRVWQPSHLPSIYRGKGEVGGPPPDGSRGEAAAKGGMLAPQAKGAPPLEFPQTLGALGPWGAHQPTRGLGPSHIQLIKSPGAGGPTRWTSGHLSVVLIQYR